MTLHFAIRGPDGVEHTVERKYYISVKIDKTILKERELADSGSE
jgi:hypothetical protein